MFSGVLFDVYQWQQDMFDGSKATFEMLKRCDSVDIIAIKDDKVVILKEQQPNSQEYYALPGGRHDVPGEDVLAAAKRELLEETGYEFKKWKLLKVTQFYDKIEFFIYLWLATDFVKDHGQSIDEQGEKIKVLEKNLQEVKQLVHDPENRYVPKEFFEDLSSLDELINMPVFEGKEVDR